MASKLQYGFYGDVLLYSLLVNLFETDVLISKGYFYSPLEKGEPKGFDAYHLIQHGDKVELWLGEAKFRSEYKRPINEVLSGFSKTTTEGYFRDNVLTIVKEKHNISNANIKKKVGQCLKKTRPPRPGADHQRRVVADILWIVNPGGPGTAC